MDQSPKGSYASQVGHCVVLSLSTIAFENGSLGGIGDRSHYGVIVLSTTMVPTTNLCGTSDTSVQTKEKTNPTGKKARCFVPPQSFWRHVFEGRNQS
jgi:hypothetical protein